MPSAPAIGDDVTALMGSAAAPPVGADVSHLMSPLDAPPQHALWAPSGSATQALGTTAAVSVPIARIIAEELATNPNVAKIGATIGRTIGGIAPAIGGAAEAGPVGFLAGLAAASRGAWAGGKTGWFTGKLAQQLAAPAAKFLAAIEPYTLPASALSAEGSALEGLSSPSGMAAFAKSVNPTIQDTLLKFYQDRGMTDHVNAIRAAIATP